MSDTKVTARSYTVGPSETFFVSPLVGQIVIDNFQTGTRAVGGSTGWTFNNVISSNGTSFTFVDGIAVVGFENNQDSSASTMTINGVVGTPLFGSDNGLWGAYYAQVTAGSGTISMTGNIPPLNSICGIAMLTGASSVYSQTGAVYSASDNTSIPTSTAPLPIPAGGVGIAWICDLGGVSNTVVWSGAETSTSIAGGQTGGGPFIAADVAMNYKTSATTMDARGDLSPDGSFNIGWSLTWGP